MPKSINQRQIIAMYQTGCFSNAAIARRLDVSEKTVQRVISDNLENGMFPAERFKEMTPEDEKAVWLAWFRQGAPYSYIAYCFGVKRQTVVSVMEETLDQIFESDQTLSPAPAAVENELLNIF
jgi:DNA-binding CsgD family transcriptional regulator